MNRIGGKAELIELGDIEGIKGVECDAGDLVVVQVESLQVAGTDESIGGDACDQIVVQGKYLQPGEVRKSMGCDAGDQVTLQVELLKAGERGEATI